MSESTQRPAVAPSRNLLGQFAQQADKLRTAASDHQLTASTAQEAAKAAQADADQLGEQVRALLAEVERVRGVMAEAQRAADEHGDRAARHQAQAEELLADATYLDGVLARAEQLPPFQQAADETVVAMPRRAS